MEHYNVFKDKRLWLVCMTGVIALSFLAGVDAELDRQQAARNATIYCAMAGANETYCNDKH